MKEFKKELSSLINRYSLENGSNTPDFILAEYLVNCLKTYNKAVQTSRPNEFKTKIISLSKPKELDWKKTIFNKITEELVKFCRKGDNTFIDPTKYSGKRRNKFVFALTQYIQSLLTQQRTEIETHFSKEKKELLEEIKGIEIKIMVDDPDSIMPCSKTTTIGEKYKEQFNNLLIKKDE